MIINYLHTMVVYMYYVRGSAAKRKRNLRDRVGSVLSFWFDHAYAQQKSDPGKRGKSWIKIAFFWLFLLLMWQGNTFLGEKGNHVADNQSIAFPEMGIRGNGWIMLLVLYVAMITAFSDCLRLSY